MDKEELQKILGISNNKEPKIEFVKTSFTPEKIQITPIFERMYLNSNFKQEILRINNDIKTAFTNLIKLGVHKQELPMLSASLFNQLMISFDRANTSYLDGQSAPEWTQKELKKISETQYKIYKVLAKIEEDLIDEQDTSIKDRNVDLLDKIKKMLDERDARLRKELQDFMEGNESDGDGDGGGIDFGDLLTLGSMAGAGYRWIKGKINNFRVNSNTKKLRQSNERAKRLQNELDQQRKKLNEQRDKLSQKQIEENEKRIKDLEKQIEKEKAQIKKTEDKLKNLKGEPKPPVEPKPGPSTPEQARAKGPIAKRLEDLAKRFPKIAKVFGSLGPIFKKAMIGLDVFILLPMEIANFWNFSLDPKNNRMELGLAERVVYCLVAGLTQWVENHARIVEDLVSLFKEIIDKVFVENLEVIAGDDPNMFGFITTAFKFLSKGVGWLLENVVSKYTNEFINYFKKVTGAETGDTCGMHAVALFNDASDGFWNFVQNSLPNESTYELIMGQQPVMEDLIRRGIYKYNKLGFSELKYNNASEIAEHMTESEIQQVLRADDVSSEKRAQLLEAVNIKAQRHITDRDVLKAHYHSGYLDSLVTVLNGKSGKLNELWLTFAQSLSDCNRDMMLFFGTMSIIVDIQSKKVTPNILPRTVNLPEKELRDFVESLFKAILSWANGNYQLLGFGTGPEEELYFTTFGTLINVSTGSNPFSPINADRNVPTTTRILGYIDKSGNFQEKKINSSDEIVEETLKKNKRTRIPHSNIVAEDVVSQVETSKISSSDVSSGLPAHLRNTYGTTTLPSNIASYAGEYLGSETIPTSLSASGGSSSTGSSGSSGSSGTYVEVSSNAGTSVPDLGPGYSGTDYTSVEAIKKARVYEKNGKWFSDNPFVDAIIQIESMRNASARPWSKKKQRYLSTAAGLFQFIDDTGRQYGLHSLNDKLDPYKSLEAFKRYTLDNIKALKSKGIPVTPATVYLCHQQGAGGLSTIYKYITGKGPFPSAYVGTMSGNTHGHPYKDPVDWFNNWANDIARLMGQTPKMPSMSQPPEHIQSYSGTSESPGNFSSSQSPQSPQSTFGQAAPEGAPSYVQDSYSLMQKSSGGNPMAKAAAYARTHISGKKPGWCARYVANALEAVGLKFRREESAYMYHTNGTLSKLGFGLVSRGMSGYTPEPGDICVIDRFNGHKDGHICIWDGKNWISDFVQKYGPSPYSDGPGPMYFYRYGGPDLVPNESMESNVDYNPSTNTESYSPSSSSTPEPVETGSLNISNTGSEKTEPEGEAENLFDIPVDFLL